MTSLGIDAKALFEAAPEEVKQRIREEIGAAAADCSILRNRSAREYLLTMPRIGAFWNNGLPNRTILAPLPPSAVDSSSSGNESETAADGQQIDTADPSAGKILEALADLETSQIAIPDSMNLGDDLTGRDLSIIEEVIIRRAAPVYRVENGTILVGDDDTDVWGSRVKAVHDILVGSLPSVGRVEARLAGNTYVTLGTAWIAKDGLIFTNRHVADNFIQRGTRGLVFRQSFPGPERMGCRIDFSEDPSENAGVEIPIDGILFLSSSSRPDVAVMRLAEGALPQFKPLELKSSQLTKDDFVAVVGYPEKDERARKEDILRVYGDVFGCKRFAPGFVKDTDRTTIKHLCSTLGGNSGSPVLDLRTGQVAGMHFGGLTDTENYAESAMTIQAILEQLKTSRPIRIGTTPTTTNETPMNTGKKQIVIPLSITIEIGDPSIVDGKNYQISSDVLGGDAAHYSATRSSVDEAVEIARLRFSGFNNVVQIRKGWKFQDGWITDEEAVVIAVTEKKPLDTLKAEGMIPLPPQINGVPVDVKTSSPFDVVPELADDLLMESFIRQGTYKPRPDLPLEMAERRIKGIIGVGPDMGFSVLNDFLKDTDEELVVGMYEFTAPHIVEAMHQAVGDDGRLILVLQKGENIGTGTKSNDQTDEETVRGLEERMESRLKYQWASIGHNAVFPYAYHIKVAVRDRSAFWLSSGSWQSSNQPPFVPPPPSPEDPDAEPHLLDDYNREWHVVIEDTAVSERFAQHIERDVEESKETLEVSPADVVVWVDPLAEDMLVAEAPTTRRYFSPHSFHRRMSVQPILTPDNYVEHVLPLIRNAKKSIMFQNQSLNIAKNRRAEFTELLDALKEKQESLDDVRIIIRGEYAREQIERMKSYGFAVSADYVRLQNRCHAKTMIIDGHLVLIGSHNFTNSGTTANRDASLLFDDRKIADYCAEIFEYDWMRSREVRVRDPLRGAILAQPGTPKPHGMVAKRITDLGIL